MQTKMEASIPELIFCLPSGLRGVSAVDDDSATG